MANHEMRTANGPSLKSEDTRPIRSVQSDPLLKATLDGGDSWMESVAPEHPSTCLLLTNPLEGSFAVRRHPNVESSVGRSGPKTPLRQRVSVHPGHPSL
jgi:hypothetical protein